MNKVESKTAVTDKLYWVVRTAVLAAVVLIFLPAINPARITALINKNMSLFTSAVSIDGLTQDVGIKIRTTTYTPFYLVQTASICMLVGIIVMAVGASMSLGNLKLKKRGNIASLVGALVTGGSFAVFMVASNMFSDKLAGGDAADLPFIPAGMYVYLGIAAAVLVFTLIAMLMLPKLNGDEKCEMPTKYTLFLIMLPFLVLVFAFSYLPLWGWRYSFFDYKPGQELSMDNWVGFKWFTRLLSDPATRKDVMNVLRNTLVMSGLGIATSWVPMAFAILLNEIKTKWFRKGVQVITTIPNFVSWVLVFALAFAIFSGDGFINTVLGTHVDFLGNAKGTWFKMLAWGMWKSVGWSAIIYVAGISGIDPQLYEAATVDGAGRGQKMWHITVPGLIPTYMVLLLMSIGNILSNGMDQYLVFSNSHNISLIQVLDLYVYNLGLEGGAISLSTVVSMTKSIISVILLFTANGISKLIRGESIM
ncbi:MAG: ABC transporter permease subunit [Butyrivibrio sp.]|nr:ABC transporter permease subunit [Butyrivibrio sp.]